ncbi:Bifunctional aspartokinase/homoserine dehydrogenase 1 [Candidatus Annandia adelgestsuga]|uniref:Bifunctional aspartokinase/homoserine dehydrogenase n=1 Tax=Candidatus Annandia adelgestsuga TaxID=1302411 RepID=A0A3S5HNW9_9ENTR|nr:bifunctional aspartate kinase/homoserine dehydrogenase I [Candidatus Annandia adelgestsuga]AZP36258.1 Bifunctional aspartokinase/homoserine dehydrogenase 1 [Candidatus Annandia adelgestsuga]
MKVLKFGGTSLANAYKFLSVAKIIKKNSKKYKIFVVLSAPSKITNYLISIIKKKIKNKFIDNDIYLIKNFFFNLILKLKYFLNKFNDINVYNLLQYKFIKLKKILYGVGLFKKCSKKIYAKIICLGEKFSVIIMSELLKSYNYNISIINPVKCLVATGNILESEININKSRFLIKKQINNNICKDKKNITLMAGFTAGNINGDTVVLGRNGSDYSAAILASCLKVNCCEIWTDVDGIYTCDPKKINNAILLKNISYKEAIELSYFGAKILHPRTILPLLKFNIPCLIKNTNNSNSNGTTINSNINKKKYYAKGITYLKNIVMFSIYGSNLFNIINILSNIINVILKENISVNLITQSRSENSISFCVPQKEINKTKNLLYNKFNLEFKNKIFNYVKIIKNLSIISLVGSNIKKNINILSLFFSSLSKSKIKIISISQESSRNIISIIVNNYNLTNAVKIIHQNIFFKEKKIELFIIGIGAIGKTLIKQICKQQFFLNNQNINLKIYGIANSKYFLTNKNGINLNNWKLLFNKKKNKFNIINLLKFIKNNNFCYPIIIDCTSSNLISNEYFNFISNNINIVTANKKANTSSLYYYYKIKYATINYNCKFLYETNVGAGLPIIENLKNLLCSGDKIINFSGILSGSLSFIFGKLDKGVSFSKSIKMACKMGFTEPDPREDLSGMDVARKLLILAREIGYTLELKDIKITPIIPNFFKKFNNLKKFMKNIHLLDNGFKKIYNKINKKNKVLRFVGIIKSNGKCLVKIKAINKFNPLYEIKNGENALVIYSKYYNPIPLVVRGYGAGNNVTAAGIFSDLFRIIS